MILVPLPIHHIHDGFRPGARWLSTILLLIETGQVRSGEAWVVAEHLPPQRAVLNGLASRNHIQSYLAGTVGHDLLAVSRVGRVQAQADRAGTGCDVDNAWSGSGRLFEQLLEDFDQEGWAGSVGPESGIQLLKERSCWDGDGSVVDDSINPGLNIVVSRELRVLERPRRQC